MLWRSSPMRPILSKGNNSSIFCCGRRFKKHLRPVMLARRRPGSGLLCSKRFRRLTPSSQWRWTTVSSCPNQKSSRKDSLKNGSRKKNDFLCRVWQKQMISVIIPTYNEIGYVPATIESVAGNKTEKEVIVVDAGSVD